ncbi:MAG: iron-sulfur cluster assembly accessory protein [Candidatus Thalassarchaeum betae]|nr:iron-sulfur cluster assembly accessory protein [Candidatus Thalassoarchaea betae]MEC7713364.1 iron-sulfur cluster assembly accessory protein [Candidatus Thermoplasmatota archaeon]MEE3232443.1 iron-sulfur cluster assembly accessory protein [Candidatus Thermoplasmatota archaeon]MEE3277563.1 iron-sulfur cluster assembly accessory protein [Candidatus Thermoplasmatota archaeon]
MLSISPKAGEMLDQFASQTEEASELCLRVEIIGRGPKGFQYDLQFIDANDAKDDDIRLQIEDREVLVAARSAQYLEGTTLDYKETLMGGGFSFDNPNPMWMDELSKAVADIIASEVNPVVASHGGHVDLIGVDSGKAIIAFGGGCQGCGMVDVTLKQGVEVMIKDSVPGISEVVDATDHAAGTNPFY